MSIPNRQQPPSRLALHAVKAWAILYLLSPCLPVASGQDQPTDNAATTRPAPVVTEDGPVRVQITLPEGPLVSGESFELQFSIETVEGVQVGPPEPGGLLGVFEVMDVKRSDGGCSPPKACLSLTLSLMAHFPGTFGIPSLAIPYYDDRNLATSANDAVAQQLNTPEIPIEIGEGLADVRGPVSVALPIAWRLIGYVVGALASIAVIGWLARRLWPTAATPVTMPPPPPLPPYEWALRAFRELEEKDLIPAGQIKAYYFEVNAIIRGYIEREFGFNAGEQTSEEFVRALRSDSRFSTSQQDLLRAFVDACDPVKYAGQTPPPDQITWVKSTAVDFVTRTHATREAERQEAERAHAEANDVRQQPSEGQA